MSRSDTGEDSVSREGEMFGPYEVLDRIGIGGMATVHRAREHGIEGFARIVALKRLLPHLAESAEFVRSFVHEAKLASQLTHQNIVQIYELGRVGTEYFISMELIEGDDLRKVLRASRRVGPPPIAVILAILEQLCDALDFAHTRTDGNGKPLELVHRDVSPSNVIITPQGVVKVIDFGIAKATTQQHRTRTGAIKGKFAYLSPEGISGEKVDARSDIFATGILAHELLTARPLFARKNDYDTIMEVQKGHVQPPSAHNVRCPPEVDRLVMRALDRDPERRYQSAREMRQAIRHCAEMLGHRLGHDTLRDWLEKGSDPPAAEDDDEVLEIAWGGRSELDGVPLVIEGVPDRSVAFITDTPAPEDEANASDSAGVFARNTPRPDTPPPTRAARRFGEHLIERERRSWTSILFGMLLLGALAGGVFLLWKTRQADKGPRADATLRFDVQPAGATIEIEGLPPHVGSRHSVDVRHGRYKVSVRKTGHESWVSHIDLKKGDTQTMRVVLAKSGSTKARVSVKSDPEAMPITIDGKPSGMVTPTTFELEPGEHTLEIYLSDNNSELPLWTHTFEAAADTTYELHPTLSKARIKRHRRRMLERRNRSKGGGSQEAEPPADAGPPASETPRKSRDAGNPSARSKVAPVDAGARRSKAAKRPRFDAAVRRPYR